MRVTDDVPTRVSFEAEIVHWRGPAPYLFAAIPACHAREIRCAAQLASYGWGCVPVEARIGTTEFTTSLFPRDGTYLLPIKVAVQKAERIGLGDAISVVMQVKER